jgi:hypothetical protein
MGTYLLVKFKSLFPYGVGLLYLILDINIFVYEILNIIKTRHQGKRNSLVLYYSTKIKGHFS